MFYNCTIEKGRFIEFAEYLVLSAPQLEKMMKDPRTRAMAACAYQFVSNDISCDMDLVCDHKSCDCQDISIYFEMGDGEEDV